MKPRDNFYHTLLCENKNTNGHEKMHGPSRSRVFMMEPFSWRLRSLASISILWLFIFPTKQMIIKRSVQLTEQTQRGLWPPDVIHVLSVNSSRKGGLVHHLGTDRCSLATFEHRVTHPWLCSETYLFPFELIISLSSGYGIFKLFLHFLNSGEKWDDLSGFLLRCW